MNMINIRNFIKKDVQLLFSREEAIQNINSYPKLLERIDNNISPDKLKEYYIYLLTFLLLLK